MKAIAAMSTNRVIGRGNTIPWHLPEDFKWFKRATLAQTVIMGRTTFLSLGKPLPGRKNFVLTRNPEVPLPQSAALSPGTELILASNLAQLAELEPAWLIGGASIYEQFLPECTDLYLSVVFREVEGDAYFPPFEHLFAPDYSVEFKTEDFEVRRYRRVTDFDHSRCGREPLGGI